MKISNVGIKNFKRFTAFIINGMNEKMKLVLLMGSSWGGRIKMQLKKSLLNYTLVDIILLSIGMISFIFIFAKLFHLPLVKDLDTNVLVAMPAIIIAYYAYKINKRQTNQMIISQYTKHMEDFFEVWTKYQNSFPLPKYKEMGDINPKIEKIPGYAELKNKLLVLNIRAGKFASTEIANAMQTFWVKFGDSGMALQLIWMHKGSTDEGVLRQCSEAKKTLEDNVGFFFNDGPNDGPVAMNNAYSIAIQKLI